MRPLNAFGRTIVAAVIVLFCAAAVAAQEWAGPGWYQMEGTIEGDFFRSGPYPSETACTATLPQNNPVMGLEFYCKYFERAPE